MTERAKFWELVWELGEIIHSETFTSVLDESISIDRIPKWFQGAKLNFAENLLEKGEDDAIAVLFKGFLNSFTSSRFYILYHPKKKFKYSLDDNQIPHLFAKYIYCDNIYKNSLCKQTDKYYVFPRQTICRNQQMYNIDG